MKLVFHYVFDPRKPPLNSRTLQNQHRGKLGTKTIFLDFPKNTIIYVCFVNYFVYLTLNEVQK